MDATSFEFNVMIPQDVRYVEAMRDLAIHAARYAGCAGADADRYGTTVEMVVRACLAQGGDAMVPVVVRRGDGPVEFLIACHGGVETASSDSHIAIEVTEEAGRRMCRIARRMPAET